MGIQKDLERGVDGFNGLTSHQEHGRRVWPLRLMVFWPPVLAMSQAHGASPPRTEVLECSFLSRGAPTGTGIVCDHRSQPVSHGRQ